MCGFQIRSSRPRKVVSGWTLVLEPLEMFPIKRGRFLWQNPLSCQGKLDRITDLRLSIQGDLEALGCGQRAGIEEGEKEHKEGGAGQGQAPFLVQKCEGYYLLSQKCLKPNAGSIIH